MAATCAGCGAAMDPSRATYDKMGNLLCPMCAAKDTIQEGEGRAVSGLTSSALGVLVMGVLSWTCLNAFFLLSFGAVLGAIGWLVTIVRAPEYQRKLGWKFAPCMIAVILGLVTGAGSFLTIMLGMSILDRRR